MPKQISNYMRADARQATGGTPDISQLLGTWYNTNPETDYFTEIILSEREGALLVRAYGAGDAGPVDWGEARATVYVFGRTLEAGGFHASYEFETIETHLAANQKLGILVIQSYTSFKDGSRRANHYAREFFHQA